jgi:hypothetical protein
LHRLRATVSAQLFMRIGSTVSSRTLDVLDFSLHKDITF